MKQKRMKIKFTNPILFLFVFLVFNSCSKLPEGGNLYFTSQLNTEPYTYSELKNEPTPEKHINLIPDADLETYSSFLDEKGFVPELSQSNLKEQMSQYKYAGTKITDILKGSHISGKYSIFSAEGKLFGYNMTSSSTDGLTLFYTKVDLEGFTLPHDINFEDTVTSVLQKTGIPIDPCDSFTSDENAPWRMTLYYDGNTRLEFMDRTVDDNGNAKESEYKYALKYSEAYPVKYDSGESIDVVRSFTFSFDKENNKLGHFEMVTGFRVNDTPKSY